MLLHDAILEVLKASGCPMSASKIAAEINRTKTYTRRDQKPIGSRQISARVSTSKYSALFTRNGGRIAIRSRKWSGWRRFPDPRCEGFLVAPFGPGCYELRNGGQLVLVGIGNNVAYRMSSLLPKPLGRGTRNNAAKRDYVLAHLGEIEYRTLACGSRREAAQLERERKSQARYLYPT